LFTLFALSLFVTRAPGDGVGFIAGLAFALVVALHALVFGAAATKNALPLWLARALLGLSLIAMLAGAGAPGLAMAPQLMEGALFAATAMAAGLIVVALFGRVPTLRDAEW
jgi:multisubunit Na+/H+ antiporter MnhB subunit